jgi:transcriptional regulator with XRE-family HTH domain
MPIDNLSTRYAKLFRKQRLALGLSQEELAERIGVSQSRISRVERGEHNLQLTTIEEFAKALEIALDENQST